MLQHADIYSPVYYDCKAALESGQNTSGRYKVQPDDLDPFFVCTLILVKTLIMRSRGIT